MSAESSNSTERNSEVKFCADRFREIAKGTNKIALLWIAALIIVWSQGLERVQRDAGENFRALQQVNLERQQLENEIRRDHQSTERAILNSRELDAHKEQNNDLDKYKRELADARRKNKKNEEERLQEIINDIRLRITPLRQLSKEEQREAIDVRKSEELKRASLKVIAEKKGSRAEREKQFEEKQAALATEHQTLKQQRKGVSFDILNQKFEVPPLYAPLIWSLFLIGLILYMARSRFLLLVLCTKALLILSHGTNTASITSIGEAPWWLAPLPDLPTPATEGRAAEEPAAAPVLAQQLCRLVGWQRVNRVATILLVAGLFLLILFQVRVAWLEIAMSRQLGSMRERAVVPLIVTAILFLTFVSLWLWFRLRYVPELDAQTLTPVKPTRWHGLLFFGALAGLGLLSVFMWRRPQKGLAYEAFLGSSLSYMALLLTAQTLLFCFYLWFKLRPAPAGSEPVSNAKLPTRRRFLFGVGAIALCVLGVVPALSDISKKKHRKRLRPGGRPRSRHWKGKKAELKRLTVDLLPGFYQNPRSKLIHYVSEDRQIFALANSRTPSKKGRPLTLLKKERLQPYLELSPSLQTKSKPYGESSGSVERVRGNDSQPAVNGATVAISKSENKKASRRAGGDGFNEGGSVAEPTLLSLYQFEPIKQKNPDQETPWQTKPRVNLSTSSHAFEQAALSILRNGNPKLREYGRACEMLTYSINHDIYLNNRAGSLGSFRLPSFRLYDLLAGISLRYDESTYFKEMLRLIEAFDQRDLFESRLKKWQNPNSSWYKRWSNHERPIDWARKRLK